MQLSVLLEEPDRAVVFHRYGLPVNFQAMLLQPNKKNMKKLREVLYDLYKHLDSSAAIIDVSLKSCPTM